MKVLKQIARDILSGRHQLSDTHAVVGNIGGQRIAVCLILASPEDNGSRSPDLRPSALHSQ